MDGCKGKPKTDAGHIKPCPKRDECARYALHLADRKPSGYSEFFGPYDFDDEECGQFMEQ